MQYEYIMFNNIIYFQKKNVADTEYTVKRGGDGHGAIVQSPPQTEQVVVGSK